MSSSSTVTVNDVCHLEIRGVPSADTNVTFDNSSGIRILNATHGGTVNNQYGMRLATQTGGGTTNVGIDMGENTLENVGASGNDWTANALTLAGSIDQAITLTTTGDAYHAYISLNVPAEGTGDPHIQFYQGDASGSADNMGYILGYDTSLSHFRLHSRATDGSSTDADIFRITDGTEVMILNANHGSNFDYVCDSCGRAEIEFFECCGTVAWHDDVLALREMALNRDGLEHMAKLGVMNISTNDDGSEWIGLNLQPAQHFTWSAMHQMYNRINELEAKLEALGV
jgi:hypothetical protein